MLTIKAFTFTQQDRNVSTPGNYRIIVGLSSIHRLNIYKSHRKWCETVPGYVFTWQSKRPYEKIIYF